MIYTLAVDPGKSGGYALFDEYNLVKYGLLDTTSKGFNKILKECIEIADGQLEAILERPFLAQASNDTMYINYGRILANLEIKNIPYIEIRSQQWLKALKLKKTNDNKKPSKDFIQNLYPEKDFRKSERSKKVHDGITDAVCIGLYKLNNL